MLGGSSPQAFAPATLVSFAPGSGERLGEVDLTPPGEVAGVVARAREAQVGWAALDVEKRCRVLERLKGVILDRAPEIAQVVSSENGKPPCEAMGMMLPLCEAIKLYTGLARRLDRGVRKSATFFLGSKARVYYDPLGVAGYILPWNFPFDLGVKQMVPALVAGNAVVQKPSEVNPLIGEMILGLFSDAGVPDGVVQMIHGRGEVGAALIDEVDVVCFVGSPATGRKVMERASRRLVPVVLELGGNDAAVVRADADLDLTARGLVSGTCFNAGQVCNGIERIYAPAHLVPALTQKIVEVVDRLRQAARGDYDLGPIAWEPQRRVYEAHTADALDKGATLHRGGEAVERDGGLFWPPTVLTGMNHDMVMMREETFGPFLPIMAVAGDDEAVARANDSDYGLGGSVWTRDKDAGVALARRIRAGSVMVNNAVQSGGCVTLPFGGEGESGVGRTQGEMGYFNYVAPQSVMTCPDATANLWMPYHDGVVPMVTSMVRMFHGRSILERARGAVGVTRHRPPSKPAGGGA